MVRPLAYWKASESFCAGIGTFPVQPPHGVLTGGLVFRNTYLSGSKQVKLLESVTRRSAGGAGPTNKPGSRFGCPVTRVSHVRGTSSRGRQAWTNYLLWAPNRIIGFLPLSACWYVAC